MSKLSKLLNFVYQYVPFYQKAFKKLKIKPSDIRQLDDLKVLPIINKAFVNQNYDDFIPKYKFQNLRSVKTSGSSGETLSLQWHPNFYHLKAAANRRHMHWAGVRGYDKTIGFEAPFFKEKDRNSCKIDYKTKTFRFDTRNLKDENLQIMINRLNEVKPDIIYGFFSILNLLANYLKYNDIKLAKYPKSIITTAELPDDVQRKNIEEIFHSQIFDWYGNTEGCASAAQCEYGSYHINMEYCLVDFVGGDGGITRIVGTNLENLAFPLIRYDLGDSGHSLENNCPCKRGLGLMKVVGGRLRNFVKAADGTKFFVPYSFPTKAKVMVKEAQIVQNEIDSIDVFLVERETLGKEDFLKLTNWLGNYLDGHFKINIHVVEKIKRGPRGKYQGVVCNL
jgi:phenylacetate-CoA ligase